jgi:hypothetical protein
LPTGSLCMPPVGHWEPYEPRGSRTDLGARGGEIPPRDSLAPNRQAERYAREGVPISLSTMADPVGASCVALDPILRHIEAHVLSAERLHGDDTTVPVLAKGKPIPIDVWFYVRDDMPFGGRRAAGKKANAVPLSRSLGSLFQLTQGGRDLSAKSGPFLCAETSFHSCSVRKVPFTMIGCSW